MVDGSGPASGDIEGCLDGLQDGMIRGWAWRSGGQPGAATEPLVVELVAEGAVIAATPADRLRSDLADAGKGDGRCAFEFPITARFPRGVPIIARAQDDNTSLALAGAPVVLAPATPSPFRPSAEAHVPVRPAARGPGPLSGPSGIVGYIDVFGPDRITGWAWWPGDLSRFVTLALREGGREIARIEASGWRPDLYEHRQGDGRCGVDVPVPEALRDGQPHRVEIVLADTGEPLTAEPFPVCIFSGAPAPTGKESPRRPRPDAPIQVSFVVNFYNMRREAERTLTSLTRAYQRGVEDVAYEVLCIDNGSDVPLEQAWVEGFGPEFRLFRPSRISPSPCAAINEAVRSARGRSVAIMIDGAHLLTPGVLREAIDAFTEEPDSIFAVRQWWLAGDQRWLSSVGYTREMEDVLFARIDWPRDGYELFRVGAPITESPNSWFDGMGESNCLILSSALYERIGGMDEGFDEPGAGFANLDLFRRAAAVVDRIVSPIGEASFHQFHGGTTTNVSDEEKDQRVRAYENRYRELRGEAFDAIQPERIYLRGRIRANTMPTARQRPWYTAEFGITDAVRPGFMPQHFDRGAQEYLQGVYAECGLHRGTVWAGRPVRLAPADLVNIQAILDTVRPEVIVTTSRDDGLIHFIDSILGAIRLEGVRIVRILAEPGGDAPSPRVHLIHGPPYARETLTAVARAVGAAERVVVLFEPQAEDWLPVEQIQAYARFVSLRSYFVFLGTVLGQPWLGYSRYWFAAAIRAFLQRDPGFAYDPTKDEQIALMCAQGYLQRVRQLDPFAVYDAALDDLPA